MSMILEQAKDSLQLIGVPPTSSNILKCNQAKELFDGGKIEAVDVFGKPLERMVFLNGTKQLCDCAHPEKPEICKHRIAAMLHEHRQGYIADGLEEWEQERQDWDSQDEVTYLQLQCTFFLGVTK